MKKIVDMLTPERIAILDAPDKKTALKILADILASADSVKDAQELENAIFERERILSTSIGLGVAIPHVRLLSVTEMTIAVGLCKKGIEYDSFDGVPVAIIFMIASPVGTHREYLGVLAKIALLLKNESLRNMILESETPEDIYSVLKGQ
ncbi:MAG: PTS sugar transporter subunit IIA [Candidatus Latescibacteria bacterium]|nr:PTS sugar transporter subunit IIA [Candidatus Latescibacterota bacterium]